MTSRQRPPMTRTTKLLCLGAIIGPPAVISAWIVLERATEIQLPQESGYAAIAIAVAVGLTCIGLLPIAPWLRFLLAVVYAPLAAYLMFFYTFEFVGMVYGDWL